MVVYEKTRQPKRQRLHDEKRTSTPASDNKWNKKVARRDEVDLARGSSQSISYAMLVRPN